MSEPKYCIDMRGGKTYEVSKAAFVGAYNALNTKGPYRRYFIWDDDFTFGTLILVDNIDALRVENDSAFTEMIAKKLQNEAEMQIRADHIPA